MWNAIDIVGAKGKISSKSQLIESVDPMITLLNQSANHSMHMFVNVIKATIIKSDFDIAVYI